jgi:uncharacterized protein (DUF486 family)
VFRTVLLLCFSNLFMTYAWYGHLKTLRGKPLVLVIFLSWGVAFFEYCFQVPGNRIGAEYFSLPQLKVIQEIVSLIVFAAFAVTYMGIPFSKNFILAGICLVGAAFFIFRDGVGSA